PAHAPSLPGFEEFLVGREATRLGGPASLIVFRGERKQIVRAERVLAAAELADHFRAAVLDQLADVRLAEERDRRERALAVARTAIAHRHAVAGVDLFVMPAVQHGRADVSD